MVTQGEMVSVLQGGGWNSEMASRNRVLAVPIESGSVIQAVPLVGLEGGLRLDTHYER